MSPPGVSRMTSRVPPHRRQQRSRPPQAPLRLHARRRRSDPRPVRRGRRPAQRLADGSKSEARTRSQKAGRLHANVYGNTTFTYISLQKRSFSESEEVMVLIRKRATAKSERGVVPQSVIQIDSQELASEYKPTGEQR